jgi:uncharacterized protein YqgQ
MKRLLFLLPVLMISNAYAQHKQVFNLNSMLAENKLVTYPGQKVGPIADGSKQGINCNGIVWLKGVDFAEGTVELDLRGRNEFLKSFLGIAYHGTDTLHYESIYFRPFNFRSPEAVRRTWSVQYMSMPDYQYDRLRKERTGQFENEIIPNPKPEDWLHARIVINRDSTRVYVNGSPEASLKVKNIDTGKGRLIGLWTSTSNGDFANLVITSNH